MIQGDGRTRDPLYKSKNKQNKKILMKHSFLVSQHVSERNSFEKSWALYQIEIKCLSLSHKICLSENLSLKVWELRSSQILQIVVYMAQCHNDLASFLSPNQAKLVNKNCSKVAEHTQHSPKMLNKGFHKKSAIGQCKNKCNTNSKCTPHIKRTLGEIALCGLWTCKISLALILLSTTIQIKGFDLRGSFGLPNRFIKVEIGCVWGMN